MGVSRGAAEAEHRVLFPGFEAGAADQLGILVCLEVGEPYDHRLGMEGCRDRADTLRQALDEEVRGSAMMPGQASDGLAIGRRDDLVRLDKRHWMDADVLGDHELHARKTDTVVWPQRRLEGEIGIAEVDHDLCPWPRQRCRIDRGDLERQQSVVELTGLTLGTADRDLRAGLQHGSAGLGADDRRDTELARHDRGVASSATTIGDDGRCLLHHRLPVRTGRVGNQHLTGPKRREIGSAGDMAYDAMGNLLADCSTRQQHAASLLEAVAFEAADRLTRSHRLRTRLDDVDVAIVAVLSPFNVHRHRMASALREVILDTQREVGNRQYVPIVDAEPVAVHWRRFHIDRGLPATGPIGKSLLLAAQCAAQDATMTGAEGGLVDVELVRIYPALNDVLAQAVGPGHENNVTKS